MGDAVQQAADMSGEVGVPRVRMQEIHARGIADHLQIDRQGLQGRVGVSEGSRDLMRCGVGARWSEALHRHVYQGAKMRDKFAYVHSGAPVNIRGPLAGQDGNLHEWKRRASASYP